MARAKNMDKLTGRIGNLSFYTIMGGDTVFVRGKGGPTKRQVKSSPAFQLVRQNNMEFSGCSIMSKQIRMAMAGLAHVADYNIHSSIISMMKNIQKTDDTHEVGQRGIYLSRYRYALAGFDFRRKLPFKSLLRAPLRCSVNRDAMEATLHISGFAAGFALSLEQDVMGGAIHAGLFRITAALGNVTDMELDERLKQYVPVYNNMQTCHALASSEWVSTQGMMPDGEIKLSLKERYGYPEPKEADSFVLTVIVEFGSPDALGNIVPISKLGGGMVMEVF